MTTEALPPPHPLSGQAVVVTGTVPGLDRDQAQAAVRALGGSPSAAVSGKTDLVVAGDGAGVSKMAKARQHDVRVLDGAAFAALVADPAAWDGQPLGVPASEYVTDAAEPATEAPTASQNTDPWDGHWISKAVIFPAGAREVRLRCAHGHTWLGESSTQLGPCPTQREQSHP